LAYHVDNGIKTPEPDIVAAIKGAVDLLIENGHGVSEARPSGIEMTNLILSRLFAADGGEMVEALLEDCRTTQPSPRIAAMLEAGSPAIHQQEFARIINLWDNFRSSMLSFFNDFDVLLCPVNGRTAISLGEEEDMANYTYTSAFNLTGWPAVVVRAGTDAHGLPIGIQVVAAPFREDHCLAVAGWLESQLGEFPKPGISCGKN
jgi:amidase